MRYSFLQHATFVITCEFVIAYASYVNTKYTIHFFYIYIYKSNNRVNYIVSPCGLHKLTYLGTNSLKSHSRVLTFQFITFEGINVICRFKITFY
ncbi:hypothetical protein Hanom_Chr09g00782231 [Helianthus anomalus]